jgi:DtxR family transcriptional regulator, Mn-dependent transcriptional regulator
MLSQTEENYIKAIFSLSERDKNFETSTNKIAAKIKTKPPTVTNMLRNLKTKKLITYEKYKNVQLTSEGKKVAYQIVRKHRLWEVFLYEKLKFSWDEIHEIAEQLEHTVSDKLTDKLDEFLGFPAVDPHGDPIPDKNGKLIKLDVQALSVVGRKKKFTIANLSNSSDEFLKYLDKIGLSIGDGLEIMDKEEFDKSIIIKHKKRLMTLSDEVAKNILVTSQNAK